MQATKYSHVGGDMLFTLSQVLTSILVRKSDLVTIQYGRSAQRRYTDMDPKEQKEHLLFERFKMCLDRAGTEGLHLKVKAVNNQEESAVKVMPS